VFEADGRCLVDIGTRTGVPARCLSGLDGELRIEEVSTQATILEGKIRLSEYVLHIVRPDHSEVPYVRCPQGSHPSEAEILGPYRAHSDLGDTVQELFADHRFRSHNRDLVPEDHTYFEYWMEGTYSYSDGVITYLPGAAGSPHKLDYLRDFVAKRDDQCVWLVDPLHDNLLCQQRAKNLDLPPSPEGYRLRPSGP
jgi:hypothetical protein